MDRANRCAMVDARRAGKLGGRARPIHVSKLSRAARPLRTGTVEWLPNALNDDIEVVCTLKAYQLAHKTFTTSSN